MHNQNPANCWRGFVWRGSSASLMVLRKTFLRDCSRFDTDSIVGGSQPFHQPAVAPVGSPGSMPGGVSSMRSLLVSGLHPSRRLLPSRLRPLPKHSACRTTTPQRTESIRPSRLRVNRKKYNSVYGLYRTASHGAACLVFLVGGADLAADGVPFRVAEF